MLKRTITNMKNPPEGPQQLMIHRQEEASALSQTQQTQGVHECPPKDQEHKWRKRDRAPETCGPRQAHQHTQTPAPEESKEEAERVFQEIMAGKPPNLMKSIYILRKFNKLHTEQTHMSTPRHSVMELSKDKDKSWKLHERLATRNWAPMPGLDASITAGPGTWEWQGLTFLCTRAWVCYTHTCTHTCVERPKAHAWQRWREPWARFRVSFSLLTLFSSMSIFYFPK